MKFQKSILLCLLLIAILAITGCQSGSNNDNGDTAIEYPEREMRVIVPYDAGGTSDLVARAMADISRKNDLLDQPMLVTNMPGAGTVDGLQEVKGSKPDGYTLLLHHTGFLTGYHLGIVPWTYEEYEAVAQLAEIPVYVVVHNDAPWDDLEELIDDMKERPGEISVCLPSIGALTHFGYEMMAQETGAVGKIVVTGGTGQLTSILGKQTDVAVTSINQFVVEEEAGNVRILAATTADRTENLPHVPTFKEKGIDVEIYLRLALWAPKDTPQEVVEILSGVAEEVTKSEEFRDFADAQGLEVIFRDADELRAQMAEDDKRIGATAQRIKEAEEQSK